MAVKNQATSYAFGHQLCWSSLEGSFWSHIQWKQMSKSCFNSIVSCCRDPKLKCMSVGRLQSLVCNTALFPVFSCCTATGKSKNGGRKYSSAFTSRCRKVYWKVLTARTSLILEKLILWSTPLAVLCVLLHKHLIFCAFPSWPRLCCFSVTKRWMGQGAGGNPEKETNNPFQCSQKLLSV